MINDTSVAVAAIAVVATCVASLVWIVKFLMMQMRASLERNAKAHLRVAQATDKNTKVSEETLKFMQNLNGRLAKITQQTIDEQTVHHQTVEIKK